MRHVYYLFALVYTFIKWGFGWGMLCFILPIFPLIDLTKWLISHQ